MKPVRSEIPNIIKTDKLNIVSNPVSTSNGVNPVIPYGIPLGRNEDKIGKLNQWVLEGRKFLTDEEVKRLKKHCQHPRDLVIINLALLSGLRVKEIAGLRCGDISLETEPASLTVRNGKGGKARLVRFNGELKLVLMQYLKIKEMRGEATGVDDPLLSARGACPTVRRGSAIGGKSNTNDGHLSRRTVQRTFARMAKRAGITGHCFHHLRHTYASHLYRASNYNLRLVQKQLGHANIRTTQVYADVFDEDLNKALAKLYQ